MKDFMDNDFLLTNRSGKHLYSQVKDLPIFDYHCHLDPKEIYENRAFYNLTELWLEADHYKWRVMRNFGINEAYITGKAEPYEKFLAFAKALPSFAGNPVYHWAHLELKKYFGINEPLNEKTALSIWNKTEKQMSDGSFCARNLIVQSKVDTIFTTDDPISDLKYHALLKKEEKSFHVCPSFRPDRAINIEKSDFVDYMTLLSKASNVEITDFASLVQALQSRLNFFEKNFCAITDMSFTDFPKANGDEAIADSALKDRLAGKEISLSQMNEFKYCIIKRLALMFSEKNIAMQIHTGVLRNQNSKRFNLLGPDCGIDSVGNAADIEAAGLLFDDIEKSGKNGLAGLPKTILYTLNPNSYYTMATMLGDFADEVSGRMQLGAAWWFMDHRDGIIEQLKIFANTNGLGLFNGMLTDSRSFVSYARHDYFRRVLCSLIGEWIENGEYPDDENTLLLVKNICFYNAKRNFGSKLEGETK
ncbi:MAG: glucuronate isomerase [Treponemataceae bacterium]|nr:glucuronate isomerase [Treponemataceae bacterium]